MARAAERPGYCSVLYLVSWAPPTAPPRRQRGSADVVEWVGRGRKYARFASACQVVGEACDLHRRATPQVRVGEKSYDELANA